MHTREMHIGASVGIENSFASVNFSLPRNEAIGGATRAQQGASGDSLRREPHPVRSIVSDQAMPQSGEPSVRDRHLSVAAKCRCAVCGHYALQPSMRIQPFSRLLHWAVRPSIKIHLGPSPGNQTSRKEGRAWFVAQLPPPCCPFQSMLLPH